MSDLITAQAESDQVLSFTVMAGLVRGRLVQLGPQLDQVLAAHPDAPPVVSTLVAETCLVAATLASLLKYDGVFTLQAQGDGPVRLVVADITSAGTLRAMARFDPERVAAADGAAPARLLGQGQLAFTVDQGVGTERYQGIVALEGESLAEAAEGYFRQSEQLETALRLAVSPAGSGPRFGRAVLIQRLPASAAQAPIVLAEEAEEDWRRAEILFSSLTEAELLDPALAPERLLHRLYHGEDLHLLSSGRSLTAGCRCSRERVAQALAALPGADLPSLADSEGRIEVTCEFCGTRHVLLLSELIGAADGA